ncbi:transcriptional regulator [Paenibacillus sp. HMSSN-139]|nr:transcriptional regulator [Paenibacillus sp. HMSSN-139]
MYASKGKGGGIGLLPDFVLNKSLLSEVEQKEILFGLQSLEATNALQTSRILSKLSTLFRKEEVQWIDVDFSGWNSGEAERSKFGLLKTAILEQRVVKFVYYSSYGQRTERQAEPLKMQFKNRSWYLQCYCLQSRELRTFKISRIEELVVTETLYERRDMEVTPLDAAMQDDRFTYVDLELLFPPHMAFRIFDEFERTRIRKREDGQYLVTATYPEDSWVYGYLLSFGENVTVVSPPHIREVLRDKAKKIAERYSEPS